MAAWWGWGATATIWRRMQCTVKCAALLSVTTTAPRTSRQREHAVLIISTAIEVTKLIFAVLYVGHYTRCYKKEVFLHLYLRFVYLNPRQRSNTSGCENKRLPYWNSFKSDQSTQQSYNVISVSTITATASQIDFRFRIWWRDLFKKVDIYGWDITTCGNCRHIGMIVCCIHKQDGLSIEHRPPANNTHTDMLVVPVTLTLTLTHENDLDIL